VEKSLPEASIVRKLIQGLLSTSKGLAVGVGVGALLAAVNNHMLKRIQQKKEMEEQQTAAV